MTYNPLIIRVVGKSPVPQVDMVALEQMKRVLVRNPDATAEQLAPQFGGLEKAKTLILAAKVPVAFQAVSLDVSKPETVPMKNEAAHMDIALDTGEDEDQSAGERLLV